MLSLQLLPECLRCFECDGEGRRERLAAHLTGPDALQHVWREESQRCRQCDGTGRSRCAVCGSKWAVQALDAMAACAACATEVAMGRTWADVSDAVGSATMLLVRLQRDVTRVRDAEATGRPTPAANEALPEALAATDALLSVLASLTKAMPTPCGWCALPGGAPTGAHGRCTVCVHRCEECNAELADADALLCGACAVVEVSP